MDRRTFLKTMAGISAAGIASTSINYNSRYGRWLNPDRIDTAQPFDVYMTFDDGPFSNKDFKTGPTDIVLQLLKDKGITATFFLHGMHINDWDGPTLARYITDGHSVGNHLWRQGGNTIADNTPWALMAEQYLRAEIRIRDIMQQADATAYQTYMAQPKLFRRPGGNNNVNDFLKPQNWLDLRSEPYLRPYWDKIDWLNGVYDYSGWHINGGESIPAEIRPTTANDELQFILHGGHAYYGIYNYIQPRSVQADQGLVILMHDADKTTDDMLPDLISTLQGLGARFKSLPRPVDKPNATTVGISYAPIPELTATPASTTGAP